MTAVPDAGHDLPCVVREGVDDNRTTAAAELRKRVQGRFLVIAHRGYSRAHPENTRAAFEAAIEAGADLIETDVRQSADGALFLAHDDVGDHLTRELEELGVLRLEALLELARDRIVLLLDIKEDNPAVLTSALETVYRHEMEEQVVFGLRSVEQVRAFRRMTPGIVVAGFLSPWSYDFTDFFRAGGDIARLWEGDIDPGLVETARGQDGTRPIWVTPRIRLHPAGRLDEGRQLELMTAGFDGALVNDPRAAIERRCRYFREATLPSTENTADARR